MAWHGVAWHGVSFASFLSGRSRPTTAFVCAFLRQRQHVPIGPVDSVHAADLGLRLLPAKIN